jgi:hypothetical protein
MNSQRPSQHGGPSLLLAQLQCAQMMTPAICDQLVAPQLKRAARKKFNTWLKRVASRPSHCMPPLSLAWLELPPQVWIA